MSRISRVNKCLVAQRRANTRPMHTLRTRATLNRPLLPSGLQKPTSSLRTASTLLLTPASHFVVHRRLLSGPRRKSSLVDPCRRNVHSCRSESPRLQGGGPVIQCLLDACLLSASKLVSLIILEERRAAILSSNTQGHSRPFYKVSKSAYLPSALRCGSARPKTSRTESARE